MRRRSPRVLLRHAKAMKNDQKKDREQMIRSSEMSFHALCRYLLAALILCGPLVDSERQVRILDFTAREDRPNSPAPAIHARALSNLRGTLYDDRKCKACDQRK